MRSIPVLVAFVLAIASATTADNYTGSNASSAWTSTTIATSASATTTTAPPPAKVAIKSSMGVMELTAFDVVFHDLEDEVCGCRNVLHC